MLHVFGPRLSRGFVGHVGSYRIPNEPTSTTLILETERP